MHGTVVYGSSMLADARSGPHWGPRGRASARCRRPTAATSSTPAVCLRTTNTSIWLVRLGPEHRGTACSSMDRRRGACRCATSARGGCSLRRQQQHLLWLPHVHFSTGDCGISGARDWRFVVRIANINVISGRRGDDLEPGQHADHGGQQAAVRQRGRRNSLAAGGTKHGQVNDGLLAATRMVRAALG